MPFIKPESRTQCMLYNSFEEMLPKISYVRIIDLMVDKVVSSNQEKFKRCKESPNGAPSYQTETLLKLLFYGYMNGIKSSRKLEAETYRNIELMWLLGNLHPDHWTISNFRKEHGKIIEELFSKNGKFLRVNDYIDLKTVAVDGTKVKANTSRDMLTIEQIEKCLSITGKELEAYCQEMQINDITEDAIEEYARGNKTGSINKALIDKIAKLESEIEEMQKYKKLMESEGITRIGKTDRAAKLMRSREGMQPCYNVQTIVDSKHHMIADFKVISEENDINQLESLVAMLEEQYGEKPEKLIGDTGYFNLDSIERLEESGIEVYVSPKAGSRVEEIEFEYNEDKDEYICSEGKVLKLSSRDKKRRKSVADIYQCKECKDCAKKSICTKSEKGRTVQRYKNQEFRDEYTQRMKTKKNKLMMKKRRCLVEHPFGTIKYLMGKIPLLLRGIKKVRGELSLYVMSYNLKRLMKVEKYEVIVEKMAKFNWA